MARKPVPGSVGSRLREVREATRLTVEAFVDRLNTLSTALFGAAGPAFQQGRISKLELGSQRASLEDIAIYAAIDPKHRGKLWLAWDETKDVTMRKDTPEDLARRIGVQPPRRGQQFPAPTVVKKATQVGGQKRRSR